MAFDLVKFKSDLIAARELAVKNLLPTDEGSCNHDSVRINFERLPMPSARLQIESAANDAGCSCFWTKHYGACLLISPPVPGQAYRRTHAVETMVKFLQKEGWDATTSYMMD